MIRCLGEKGENGKKGKNSKSLFFPFFPFFPAPDARARRTVVETTAGRPTERWFAVSRDATKATEARKGSPGASSPPPSGAFVASVAPQGAVE